MPSGNYVSILLLYDPLASSEPEREKFHRRLCIFTLASPNLWSHIVSYCRCSWHLTIITEKEKKNISLTSTFIFERKSFSNIGVIGIDDKAPSFMSIKKKKPKTLKIIFLTNNQPWANSLAQSACGGAELVKRASHNLEECSMPLWKIVRSRILVWTVSPSWGGASATCKEYHFSPKVPILVGWIIRGIWTQ